MSLMNKSNVEMTSKEVFDLLKQIESKLDLENFKISQIDLWPHIRNQLITMLYKNITGKDPKKEYLLNRLISKLLLIPSLIIHNLKERYVTDYVKIDNNTYNALIFTDSSHKRMKINDLWYDVIMGPIIEKLELINKRYLLIESNQRFINKSPSYFSTISISNNIVYQYIISLIKQEKVEVSKSFLKEYQKYQDILIQYQLSNTVVSLTDLKHEARYVLRLKKYLKPLIKEKKPEVVFLGPYNGYMGKAICLACNELKICTIDIQHGVQGKYHPTYNFFNVPSEGFNVLPNYFFTWSDSDCNVINKWADRTELHRAFKIGNLLLNSFLASSALSSKFDEIFKECYKKISGRNIILISLVWGSYLPDIFVNLLKKSPREYYYLLRFHPSTTYKEKQSVINTIDNLGCSNVDYEMASELPIYCLLRNVHFNITERSTTVIEADYFNVNSIITDNIARGYYEDLKKKNRIFFANNYEEILILLAQNIKQKTFKNMDISVEVPDSNFVDIIKDIKSPFIDK